MGHADSFGDICDGDIVPQNVLLAEPGDFAHPIDLKLIAGCTSNLEIRHHRERVFTVQGGTPYALGIRSQARSKAASKYETFPFPIKGAGAPCNGCTQPEFPDLVAPFYEKLVDVDLPTIGAYWATGKEEK